MYLLTPLELWSICAKRVKRYYVYNYEGGSLKTPHWVILRDAWRYLDETLNLDHPAASKL